MGRCAEQNIWCCGCSTHTTQTHGGSGMEGVTLGPIFQFSMDLERARFAHSETASLGETQHKKRAWIGDLLQKLSW